MGILGKVNAVDSLSVLQELISIPGPPGEEIAVRQALERHLSRIGVTGEVDAKGNLIVELGQPKIVVTAHMDEVAMIVRRVLPDGRLRVGPLGGLFAFKVGESPVSILAPTGAINGVLSFGSIHSEDASVPGVSGKKDAVAWEGAWITTGLTAQDLAQRGVRPGTRVVIHPAVRGLVPLGDLVSGRFLDDRADLVAWLLVVEEMCSEPIHVSFVATSNEEVGGEGALFYLQKCRPDVCIALELGPHVPDAPVQLTPSPTLWVHDSYSTMLASDGALVSEAARSAGIELQYQALSRGGSDASCAASHGLCARPITLGLAMENSHGFEVMHKDSMTELAKLTVAVIRNLLANG